MTEGPEDTKRSGTSRAVMPLALASPGQEVVFVTVQGGRGIQHRLAEMGLIPGARFRVLSRFQPGPLIISLKDCRLVLGRGMVERILVRPK